MYSNSSKLNIVYLEQDYELIILLKIASLAISRMSSPLSLVIAFTRLIPRANSIGLIGISILVQGQSISNQAVSISILLYQTIRILITLLFLGLNLLLRILLSQGSLKGASRRIKEVLLIIAIVYKYFRQLILLII